MEIDLSQALIALGGGTGLSALAVKLWSIIREHRSGSLQREDTAISRWKAIADAREEVIDEQEEELRWWRSHYPLMWAAYSAGPPPRENPFPATYPGPREGLDNDNAK